MKRVIPPDWSAEEIETLIAAVNAGYTTDELMPKLPGRTYLAIETKRGQLVQKGRLKKSRAGANGLSKVLRARSKHSNPSQLQAMRTIKSPWETLPGGVRMRTVRAE